MQPMISFRTLLLLTLKFVILSDAYAASAEVFKVRLSSQPKTFDWTIATSGSEGAVIQNIMHGLFTFKPSSHQWAHDLAKGFEWDNDSKILTITLERDVKWSDGKPLKCQHFQDSFERLLSPTLSSPNASMLFDVEHARDYFLGKEKDFSKVGISCIKQPANNTENLTFKLKEPRANFTSILSHWATFPVRKDNLKLTLGPYAITSGTAASPTITLKKTDKIVGPDTIQFQVVADGSKALLEYEAGKLDYLLQVEDDLLNPGVQKIAGIGAVDPIRVVALLHLNPTRVLTNSPEKRRAIIASLPYKELYSSSTVARMPAVSIIPRGLPGHDPGVPVGFPNPPGDRAKLPDSALTLGHPGDALSKAIAQEIQNKSTQIKIKIEPLPAGNDTHGFDLVLSLFGLDYLDPDQLLSSFLSQGTLDLFNFNSAELVKLVQHARASKTVQERGEIYAQAADLLQNRAAIVTPLFYRRRIYMLNPKYEVERGAEGTAIMSKIHLKKK